MPWPKGRKPINGFDKRKQDINRKGRGPSTHTELRKLIHGVLDDLVTEDKVVGKKSNGEQRVRAEKMTRLQRMLKRMADSPHPGDHEAILKHAFGEVPKEINFGGTVTLNVVYDAPGLRNPGLPQLPAPAVADGSVGSAIIDAASSLLDDLVVAEDAE